MEEPVQPVETPAADRATRGARRTVLVVVAVVLVGITGFVLWVAVARDEPPSTAQQVPSFASLGQRPDPALQGTVAYFDNRSRCVRVVAASGAASDDVYCLTEDDLALSPQEGKPAGPQLVWAADGRLEVTLFRWVPSEDEQSPPPVVPDWQKLIDVTTGEVQDVPEDQLPAEPLAPEPTTVSARGEEVRTDFDALTGRGEVTLSTPAGTRTLLSVRGPGEYTYGLEPASWAPDGEWIVTTDSGEGGRILVITPTEPSATRVLVAHSGGGAGGGTAGPSFAVTSENLIG